MGIQSKLTSINEKLNEAGLKTQISVVKTSPLLNKKEGLHIVVNDVQESKYIDLSAQIQTILRESLGYGTVDSSFNLKINQLELNYVPIPNAKVVSAKSSYVREQQRRYEPTGAPGCANLEK